MRKKELLIIPALLMLLFGYFNYPDEKEMGTKKEQDKPVAKAGDDLVTHYINVGQGDSIFIELPNGETMLIDAGESSEGNTILEYIKNLGYDVIDYLVITHPDSDHIGGMRYIINNLTIKTIYMPRKAHTTKTYENLLQTILDKGLSIKTAKAGVKILNEEELKIDILSPIKEEYSTTNDYSAVIKITYGNTALLFMGDASSLNEKEMIDAGYNLNADILKIGHHGSDTSSSEEFLNKVGAKYAVISVGEKNSYNLPADSILNRLKNMELYRTDKDGTIIITTDGIDISVKEEGI